MRLCKRIATQVFKVAENIDYESWVLNTGFVQIVQTRIRRESVKHQAEFGLDRGDIVIALLSTRNAKRLEFCSDQTFVQITSKAFFSKS